MQLLLIQHFRVVQHIAGERFPAPLVHPPRQLAAGFLISTIIKNEVKQEDRNSLSVRQPIVRLNFFFYM